MSLCGENNSVDLLNRRPAECVSTSVKTPAPLLLLTLLVSLLFGVGAAPMAHARWISRHPRPMVVGYFPQWALYGPHPYYVNTLLTTGSIDYLDQINFANASVQGGHCSLSDPNADLFATFSAANSVDGRAGDENAAFRGEFRQLKALKQRYPRLKILISLEGRAADFARDAAPDQRQQFVRSCVDLFIRGEFASGIREPGIFDGFDIDWESPQGADAANFQALLEEFRGQMNTVRPGMRLAVAVDQSPASLPGTDFTKVAAVVDEVSVMNYDYAGPWSSTTGFIAPLFATLGHANGPSIERSIASYRASGVPAEKLLMGIPFYGYGWTGVTGDNHGLFQQGSAVRGDRPYSYIRSQVSPLAVFRDPVSKAPWVFDGQNFWTYDDPVSLRYKVSYARAQQLRGAMIWELSGDTADAELLRSVYTSIHHPLSRRTFDLSRRVVPELPAPASTESAGAAAGSG
jgi:chitinase